MRENESARQIFKRNLQRFMEIRGMNQNDIIQRLNVSSSTASDWVRGNKYPRVDAMQALADMLDVTMAELVNDDDSVPDIPPYAMPVTRRRIPVLGNVAAGQPIWADEEYDDFVDDDGNEKADFALRVKGDSMSPIIEDGDFVYVKRGHDVRNGQIAVVLDGDSATLKYVYKDPHGVTLVSANKAYPPMKYIGEDAERLVIQGIAIAYKRSLK